MVTHRSFKVAAVLVELIVNLGYELLQRKRQPAVDLVAVGQVGCGKEQPDNVGQIVVAAVHGRPFQVFDDVPGVCKDTSGEHALECVIQMLARDDDHVACHQKVRTAYRHVHRTTPVHTESGRVR
ncbi:hypothetical protein FQZ97_836660 [compost metagenome]